MNAPRKFLGAISGTSVDGLDLALIEIDNDQITIACAATMPLPAELVSELRSLANPAPGELDRMGYADAALGTFIGEAINTFIANNNVQPQSISAIGSHGQTIRHRPTGTDRFTLQIGDPNRIAEITGITTVADFRRRDLAAGGQGAPLVPPFHKALFAGTTEETVALNIGGISNVSILTDPPTGFDTGPGNCLMDEWVYRHLQVRYDDQGQWAASGQVDKALLERLLSDPYFRASPPKSTGREYFHADWLESHLEGDTGPADVQATLAELTARCTIDALREHADQTQSIVVCGGGRLNNHLLSRMSALSGWQVLSSDALGVDGDAIEAAAFAWLAARTITGQAGNEPAVTGAAGYRVLGTIYPA